MPATWDNVLDSFEYVRINSAEYFTIRPTKHTYSPSHNNEGSAGEFPKQNVTNKDNYPFLLAIVNLVLPIYYTGIIQLTNNFNAVVELVGLELLFLQGKKNSQGEFSYIFPNIILEYMPHFNHGAWNGKNFSMSGTLLSANSYTRSLIDFTFIFLKLT